MLFKSVTTTGRQATHTQICHLFKKELGSALRAPLVITLNDGIEDRAMPRCRAADGRMFIGHASLLTHHRWRRVAAFFLHRYRGIGMVCDSLGEDPSTCPFSPYR